MVNPEMGPRPEEEQKEGEIEIPNSLAGLDGVQILKLKEQFIREEEKNNWAVADMNTGYKPDTIKEEFKEIAKNFDKLFQLAELGCLSQELQEMAKVSEKQKNILFRVQALAMTATEAEAEGSLYGEVLRKNGLL